MIGKILGFINNLKLYSAPVVENFRPLIIQNKQIVPEEAFAKCDLWQGIVIHSSDTDDGPGNDFSSISKYHTSYRVDGRIVDETTFKQLMILGHGKKFEKPWKAIGYHGLWEQENGIYKFKLGRPWNMSGAHAGITGNNIFNETHLGLCLVGKYDVAQPGKDAWSICLDTVREIISRLKIDKANVIGHREVYAKLGVPVAKSCPGKMFDMERFRSEL